MQERIQHTVLILAGLAIAVGVFIYGVKTTHRQLPLPEMVRQSLPLTGTSPSATISVSHITPYPNETGISTLPSISLTALKPLGKNVIVMITPKVSFTPVLSGDTTNLTVRLNRPLKPKTSYTISVTNKNLGAKYNWSFTTGEVATTTKLIQPLAKLKAKLPYKDPGGSFAVFYAPQTDTYFVTVHDDERSMEDTRKFVLWLRDWGIDKPESIHIVYTPSAVF